MSKHTSRLQYTERERELLQEASETYRDISDPFCNAWLNENNVTANECIWLSNEIGVILDMYLASTT
jgi:hypothetical protein